MGEKGEPVSQCMEVNRRESKGWVRGIPHLAKNERDVGHPRSIRSGESEEKDPRFPVQLSTSNNIRVPHISLVFREMWDTTTFDPRPVRSPQFPGSRACSACLANCGALW